MRNTIKYIVGSTWQPLLVKYLSRTRTYTYKDIRLQIPASVFHPGFFFSTHLLLKQIKTLPLKEKRFLEPGAGSGLLSIYAAQQGAMVTASDINPAAIKALKKNSYENNTEINIVESDLFDEIPAQLFDVIAINPPYYKKKPGSYADYAWNCGPHGEYFLKLFRQLKNYVHAETKTLMVLCDACDIGMVRSLAEENEFAMQTVFSKQNVLEKNFIYQIGAKQ
jgi:release factor glutamine methyltransferase